MSIDQSLRSTRSFFVEDISHPISNLLNFLYEVFQKFVIYLFSPPPPKSATRANAPRIAVIGAGITGVSAAAHCVGHGCDVVIFEQRSRKNLGGIWSRVNSTSSLQIYSVMYRFHPSITWHKGFPNRQRILEEVERLWNRYNLKSKTRFETPVHSVEQDYRQRWVINGERDPADAFDGVIVATGTCGDPKMPHISGQEQFGGKILHSSKLDDVDVSGKKVVIVGGGASAIEAVEYAIQGKADKVDILARVSSCFSECSTFQN
jgi:cation diffusion facilitator CzcD-associated flavoprotein CzcO